MDKQPQAPQPEPVLSKEWKEFCKRSGYGTTNATNSVNMGVIAGKTPTEVRGYYSKIFLIPPESDDGSILYPTHDHIECDGNNKNMAIESRLVNSMKSNLKEDDFWEVIGHLFVVRHKHEWSQSKPELLEQLMSLERNDQWFLDLAARVATNSVRNQPSVVVRLKSSIITYSGGIEHPITNQTLQKAITVVIPELEQATQVYKRIIADSTPKDGSFPVQYLCDALDANAAEILAILDPTKGRP